MARESPNFPRPPRFRVVWERDYYTWYTLRDFLIWARFLRKSVYFRVINILTRRALYTHNYCTVHNQLADEIEKL